MVVLYEYSYGAQPKYSKSTEYKYIKYKYCTSTDTVQLSTGSEYVRIPPRSRFVRHLYEIYEVCSVLVHSVDCSVQKKKSRSII